MLNIKDIDKLLKRTDFSARVYVLYKRLPIPFRENRVKGGPYVQANALIISPAAQTITHSTLRFGEYASKTAKKGIKKYTILH